MLLCNPVPNKFCLLCLASQDIWWHHNDLSRLVRKVLLACQWFMICSSWLPSHLSTFYFALYKPVSCITDVPEHESLNKYSRLFPARSCLAVPRFQNKFTGAFCKHLAWCDTLGGNAGVAPGAQLWRRVNCTLNVNPGIYWYPPWVKATDARIGG